MLLGALIATLMAAPTLDDAAPPEVVLADRRPIGLVLNTPSGARGRLRVSEILATLTEVIERNTDLTPEVLDIDSVRSCEGGLPCLARRAPSGAGLLVVVSYFAGPGGAGDRVAALLVDVSAVETCRAKVTVSDALEACVAESAVLGRPPAREFLSASEARAGLAGLFEQEFRPLLANRGHWEPYGDLLLGNISPGAAVLLDERIVGVASGQRLLLRGVLAGRRRLSYAVGGRQEAELLVDVVSARRTDVDFPRRITRSGFAAPLLWTGVAVAAVGLGLSAWSAGYALRHDDVRVCSESACPASFYTLEQQVRGGPEPFATNVNDGAVLALPLGYSLALAGSAWATGALVAPEDDLTHAIVLAVGVVAGGLAYGVSAALNQP